MWCRSNLNARALALGLACSVALNVAGRVSAQDQKAPPAGRPQIVRHEDEDLESRNFWAPDLRVMCFLKSTYRPRERFRALPVVSDMLVFGRLA